MDRIRTPSSDCVYLVNEELKTVNSTSFPYFLLKTHFLFYFS